MKELLGKYYDKIILHPYLGLVVWGVSYVIISLFTEFDIENLKWALIPLTIVAVLKEVNDFTHTIKIFITSKQKKFDFVDMVATFIIPMLTTAIIFS